MPTTTLEAVDAIALGFEIIDCVYTDWKFQPADLVAGYGLHAALIVGQPTSIATGDIPALAEALSQFTVKLSKDGTLIEEGSGKNALRSPAFGPAELVSAVAKAGGTPLTAGDLVSSGTLTESKSIAPGETRTASLHGLDLPTRTLRLESLRG